jgi:flagellar hook-basal body complex protein FliE
MDVASISSVSPVETSGAAAAGRAAGPSSEAPFAKFVSDLLKDVEGQQQTMDKQITDLALGKADNLHQVVVNVAETDLMFRMLMEVRDRLITSYQEIMRMQI